MKKMKWILLLALPAFLVACDKDGNEEDAALNHHDVRFITMASMSNFAEISAGQLAADKAQDSTIAEFAEMMVAEHTQAAQLLSTIAGNLGLTTKDSLDAEHVQLINTLNTLEGSAFDSVYILSQVQDHEETIELFKTEISYGQQRHVEDFAYDLLPHLFMHLQRAETLAERFR